MIVLYVRYNQLGCQSNSYQSHSTVNGTCPEGTTGSQCDVCIVGYYGNPKNNRPCQKCNCSSNNDLTVPGNCHNVTGRCSNCLSNTEGNNCEMCAEGFYGNAVNGECIRE